MDIYLGQIEKIFPEGIVELYFSSKVIDELIPEGILEMEYYVKIIPDLLPKLIKKFSLDRTL